MVNKKTTIASSIIFFLFFVAVIYFWFFFPTAIDRSESSINKEEIKKDLNTAYSEKAIELIEAFIALLDNDNASKDDFLSIQKQWLDLRVGSKFKDQHLRMAINIADTIKYFEEHDSVRNKNIAEMSLSIKNEIIKLVKE